MRPVNAYFRVQLAASALLVLPIAAHGQETTPPLDVAMPWDLLWMVAAFGAIGGVIYELIALHGNIEWPHKTKETEVPEGGFTHAQLPFLFDLGILARLIIGAAAALIVFWVLPVEQGIRLLAVSVIAGSAGTAVFRSLQDRLLAALNGAKVQELATGLEDVDQQLSTLQGGITASTAASSGVRVDKVSEIRGSVQTLLKMARR